jgi:hypothetical protein
VIVLEDDFHQSLVHNGVIGKGPSEESEPGIVEFASRAEAECRGLISRETASTGAKPWPFPVNRNQSMTSIQNRQEISTLSVLLPAVSVSGQVPYLLPP